MPAKFQTFAKRAIRRPDAQHARAESRRLAGPDVSEPEEHLVPMIEEFNRDAKAPFTMRMAVPADFEAAVAPRTDRPVFKGELNPIFQGIYSSRIELKYWMRIDGAAIAHRGEAERARGLAGLARRSRTRSGARWEPVLFNETHDLASGVMTDHVYDDTIRSYEYRQAPCRRDHRRELGRARLADRHPRAGGTGRCFQSAGLATIRHRRGRCRIRRRGRPATDPDRTPTAETCQSRSSKSTRLRGRRAEDGAARVRCPRRPRDGISHLSCRSPVAISTGTDCRRSQATVSAQECDSRIELYRIALDPATGAMTSLRVKAGDWEVLVRSRQRRGSRNKTAATSGSRTKAWTAAAASR